MWKININVKTCEINKNKSIPIVKFIIPQEMKVFSSTDVYMCSTLNTALMSTTVKPQSA